MSARENSKPDGRRRFLRAALIAGIGVTVAPAQVLAQARKAAARKPAAPRPAATPPATPPPAPPSDDARALAAILERRHPALDSVKLTGITKELDQRLDGGKRLRAVKLPNSAEPDSTFHA